MLRFVMVVLLLFVVGVGAYGNNECIEEVSVGYDPGILFENCTNDTEVATKWRKRHKFGFFVNPHTSEVHKLKLVVNDECKLDFEGKLGDGEYAKWTKGNEIVANCTSINDCGLEINKNGKLVSDYGGNDVGCNNVRNELNNTWVWTKIRVEGYPIDYKLYAYVEEGNEEEGEGSEYIPPTTTEKPTTEKPTTEEPTTLANSKAAKPPNNSALSTKLGGSIFVFVSLFFVVL
ncbi:hypothetical protein M3Y94_00003900 [Aphelenchoides besseyi]|nr:hypothetical protein M3Y94_00003900 [Aphelenchoides besseyi]KAI6220773.1 hypothetical protein M3Y95_01031500 [Aphelenchoides besseyi]